MLKNFASLTKDEFFKSINGYATSQYLHMLPELVEGIENGLKERIKTFDINETIWTLRMFSQA